MQQGLYEDRLTDNLSIKVLVPTDDEQDIIHCVIYQELCLRIENNQSRLQYLTQRGEQSIILSCAEVGSLVDKTHTKSTPFNTTFIYALAAIKKTLK
jgi:aspartate racemase